MYAEDPVRFLPSIGYLSTYKEPLNAPGLENVSILLYYSLGNICSRTIQFFVALYLQQN